MLILQLIFNIFVYNNVQQPQLPDLKPITDMVKGWGLMFLSAITGIIAVLAIFFLVKLGYKISKNAENPEERAKAIEGIIWWAIGFILTTVASAIAGVFASVFLKQ